MMNRHTRPAQPPRSTARRSRLAQAAKLWALAVGMGATGFGALTLGVAPAHAEATWSALSGPVRGTSFGEAGGIAVFVLGCGTSSGPFIQAPLPEGVRARPGRNATLGLDVDGKRFAVRGRIVVDQNAEGGPRGAVVAPVRLNDALVKALADGKVLKMDSGKAGAPLAVTLDSSQIAQAITTCGAPAPKPEASKPEAAAPADAPKAQNAEAAPKPAEGSKPAENPKVAEAEPAKPAASADGKPARSGGLPPARDIAAAIFVDPAEGQRVADKLKITPVDLNGDGAPEAIITLNDPTWCGDTGCTWFVVDLSAKPRVMGQFIGLGLAPGKDSNDGWRDLALRTPGGGSERMYYRDGTYH